MPASIKAAQPDDITRWESSLPERTKFEQNGGYRSGPTCVGDIHDLGIQTKRFNIGDRATRVYYNDREDFDYAEFGCTAMAIMVGSKFRQGKLDTATSVVRPGMIYEGQSMPTIRKQDLDVRRPVFIERCSHISKLVDGIFTGRSNDSDDNSVADIKDGWEPTDYREFKTADCAGWDRSSNVSIEDDILRWQDGTDEDLGVAYNSDTVNSLYAAAARTRMARFLASMGEQTEGQ
jgi:hypothetical protein